MRRLLFSLACFTLYSLSAIGQDFIYQEAKDQEIIVSGTFSFSCESRVAWSRVVSYINDAYGRHGERVMFDEPNQTVIIDNAFDNSKYSNIATVAHYQEDIHYTLTLCIADSAVNYTFNNLYLHYTTSTQLTVEEIKSIRFLMLQYQQAKDLMDDESFSKDDIKQAEKNMKKIESKLMLAGEAIQRRINEITVNVQ